MRFFNLSDKKSANAALLAVKPIPRTKELYNKLFYIYQFLELIIRHDVLTLIAVSVPRIIY